MNVCSCHGLTKDEHCGRLIRAEQELTKVASDRDEYATAFADERTARRVEADRAETAERDLAAARARVTELEAGQAPLARIAGIAICASTLREGESLGATEHDDHAAVVAIRSLLRRAEVAEARVTWTRRRQGGKRPPAKAPRL